MNITLNNSTAIGIQPLLTGLIFTDLTSQKAKRSSLADGIKFWKLALDHIAYPSSTICYDDENASVITDAYVDMIAEWVDRNTMNACVRIERALAKHHVEIATSGDGINNFSINVGHRFVYLATREPSLNWDEVNAIIRPHESVRNFHGFLTYCSTLRQGDDPLARFAAILRDIEDTLDCEQLDMQEDSSLRSRAQHLNNDYVNLDVAREDHLPWAESIPRYIQGFYIAGGVSATQVRKMIKSVRVLDKVERMVEIAGSLTSALLGFWRLLGPTKYKVDDLASRMDDLCSTSDRDGEGDTPSPSSQQEHADNAHEGDD